MPTKKHRAGIKRATEYGACPRCRSRNISKFGWRLLSNGRRKQRYQCRNCGCATVRLTKVDKS